MIIDIVGMRGSGKSTFCKLMKEEHGALTREDKKLFNIPKWFDFQKEYPELSEQFRLEAHCYRHYKTGARISPRTYRRKKAELCLYMALKTQLGDRKFVWDKGLLETITYFQIHGEEQVSSNIVEIWPKVKIILLESKGSFERSIQRSRNEQWDEETYERMAGRHKALMKQIPHTVILNDGSVEDLRYACQTFFTD